MINFSTDMADERRNIFRNTNKLEEISGIEFNQTEESNIKISTVKITNKEGEESIGKPIGTYITLDINDIKIAEEMEIQNASKFVTQKLKEIIGKHIKKVEDILVVGLGNEYVTADSLGPKVIKEVNITRHVLKYAPEYIDKNARPVSAISPGVLGTTGIETVEIIKGVVQNISPKLVIVIDSLCSKSLERISSSIQISDTGIIPGAGVGNARSEISKNTLGIPVIAIGVPMVVDSATITSDSINTFIEKLQKKGESDEYLNKLKDMDKQQIIKEALEEEDYNLIVTPKEIDKLIENMKSILAQGINYAIN